MHVLQLNNEVNCGKTPKLKILTSLLAFLKELLITFT